MTILDLFKTVNPSVLAAKMIFRHLQNLYPVLKISDIADTTSGGTPNRGIIEYYNGDIPWVKSGELKDGLITKCDEFITEAGLKNSSAKLFPKGTLLVAMYGANIGKTGVLDFDATTNQAVCAIFPKVNISNEYLFWYFKQQRIDFIAIGKGGAQPNISQTIINNASIVVPDEEIQKKIVDFLEKIDKENTIDESFFIPDVLKDIEQICKYKDSYVALTNGFENQLTLIENLNQAILQEAVQGKLVPQDPTDEPASQLLERIKAEKATLRQTQGTKKEKPLPPIKPEEIPFEIPENWVWCRLGEVSYITSGSTPSKDAFVEKGIPFLKMYNLRNQEIDFNYKPQYIKEEVHNGQLKRCRAYTGDVIMNIVGPPLGKIAIIPESLPECNFNQAAVLIRPMLKEMNYYIFWYLNEMSEINAIDTKGVAGQDNISVTQSQSIKIPLPPLSEQQRIVAEIERQLAKTKELKANIEANQQATEQLLKALLHGAFAVEEKEEKIV